MNNVAYSKCTMLYTGYKLLEMQKHFCGLPEDVLQNNSCKHCRNKISKMVNGQTQYPQYSVDTHGYALAYLNGLFVEEEDLQPKYTFHVLEVLRVEGPFLRALFAQVTDHAMFANKLRSAIKHNKRRK